MDARFVDYLTRPVPRYTSYPTVPHFSDRIGRSDYIAWLEALDPSKPISLYLHVPYCRQLCWYCGCNMKLAKRDAPVLSYAATLMREIRLLARCLPDRMTVGHLHWGGGTPTALTPDALSVAMETIRGDFDLAPDAEIAIESDPRTLTAAMIRRIGHLGFTRVSFGVQEFNPKVQAAINRVQPPDMVRNAVDRFRQVGVRGINFDLIYGLPHQTVATLSETILRCVEMRPDRLALFGYAHVPWMAKKQRLIDADALPGPAERLEQSETAADLIRRAGYIAVGLDHFALPDDELAQAAASGTLRRNFQGYTTDSAAALLGVGTTSISKTPRGFVQNVAETGAWARTVEAGSLPIAKGHALTSQDVLRGEVIEKIMCEGTADLNEAGRAAGASPSWYADALDDLAKLASDGVIEWDGSRISTMPEAAALARIVASSFDTYLQRANARHSVAV